MSGPNPKKQKKARVILSDIFSDCKNSFIIHYSCESFYERPEGASPRITSIAIRNLDSAQTVSFSIHQVAERRPLPPGQIAANYDDLERQMLDEYFAHIGQFRGSRFIHWNMRDINYGFAAIEYRYKVLGGEPTIVDDAKKFDLARILIDIYGVGYTGHPRLETIMQQNDIKPLDFMSGKQEADAFDGGDYVGLHRSTLRKVDVIANLAERAHNRHLKTHASWWELHGGNIRNVIEWAGENKTFALIAGLASIVGVIVTFATLT